MDKRSISLRDVQFSQLDTECLRLVSKFARTLRANSGETLRMQDPEILVKISDCAHKTRDPELKSVYKDLKHALRMSVSTSKK